MNIKIVDSWLREYLKTKATAKTIAEKLSLASVSVEKVEKIDEDFVYDIEVTSNRPDLMSVVGIAREASVVLNQFGIPAEFLPLKTKPPLEKLEKEVPLEIKNDPKLVNRICAALMEVEIKESPKYIRERLNACGIRSLNNLIDITNYVMREVGHPAHVFDFDRLGTDKLIIRESKKGEKIVTLDGKQHILQGGDIVADNSKGQIVDLLGVMGTANSVVNENTKRILYFLDNNDPYKIRKTSMSLGIRTEAAVLNEKEVDRELSYTALLRGIELYKEIANAKLVHKLIDIYPNKMLPKSITIAKEKIDKIIGTNIPLRDCKRILDELGFNTKINGNQISTRIPSFRLNDVAIEEDLVEEIARIYGYHKLPSVLPPVYKADLYNLAKNEFYWETRVKNTLKYWGFTEVYTYSIVSENHLEGPTTEAVEIANPLNEDMVYMRKTLVPSLLEVVKENKSIQDLKIFEIANSYKKNIKNLPDEILTLAGIIKKPSVSFYEAKGLIEQLFYDLGIKKITFKPSEIGGLGSSVYSKEDYLGEIELLETDVIDFEFDFNLILKHVSLKKRYKKLRKYPPIIEDLAFILKEDVKTGDIINLIKKQDNLITDVTLLDAFKKVKTFHIVYQDPNRNLSNQEITQIRKRVIGSVKKEFNASVK